MRFFEEGFERRARSRLTKYGLKLEYHRDGDRSWWTVHANEDRPHIEWPDEGESYPDIWKVLEMTEYLHERYDVE